MKIKNIWWLPFLRGIFFIIFGFIAIVWPAITLVALAFIFALLILFSGILNVISGIASVNKIHGYWFLTVLVGIFEIGIGAYALSNPGISLAALTLLIGLTFIIRSIFEIASAFENNYSTSYKALLAIGGMIGIIAGVIILRYPLAGGLAYVWILGIYALVAGFIYIALSMITRGVTDDITKSI